MSDSIATQSKNRGFSDNYNQPSLGGFDPIPSSDLAPRSTPPENPVWDGLSTGTGALENKLTGSRKTALRDSYMPLVGAAPKPVTQQAQGKSSSVPTPRSGEILQRKLLPQLGSASDLAQSATKAISDSLAQVARIPLGLPNFPFFSPPVGAADRSKKESQQNAARQRTNSKVDNLTTAPPVDPASLTYAEYGIRDTTNGQLVSTRTAPFCRPAFPFAGQFFTQLSENGTDWGLGGGNFGSPNPDRYICEGIGFPTNPPPTAPPNLKPLPEALPNDTWLYGSVEVQVTGNALALSKKLWEGNGLKPFKEPGKQAPLPIAIAPPPTQEPKIATKAAPRNRIKSRPFRHTYCWRSECKGTSKKSRLNSFNE